jgi:tagaturonate reductase
LQLVNQTVIKNNRPVKVLQFGEGNFLRAFVDYMIDIANEKGLFDAGIQIVKPIKSGSLNDFWEQDCVYTVLLRGIKGGETYTQRRVITSVSGAVCAYSQYETYAAFAKESELRFIISNTTEAGIVYNENDELAFNPPDSFPAKLTKFLYERFMFFDGSPEKGLVVLPVELIEKNGETLKAVCLKLAKRWGLPQGFTQWLNTANMFCNTLVDRIVTGYPADEITALSKEFAYTDKLLVCGEPFALWVIETSDTQTLSGLFPLHEAGLPVIFTEDLTSYRERKVRVLNGGHTALMPIAYLSGIDTVGEAVNDKTTRAFLERAVYGELVPSVEGCGDVRQFADDVLERFENPYIRHSLLSIALNSVSKFKTRVLPAIIKTYDQTGMLPESLVFSMAALIAFYAGANNADAARCYEISDNGDVLEFFAENGSLPADLLVKAFLKRTDFWDRDLTEINGLAALTVKNLQKIQEDGMREAVNFYFL